MQADGERNYHVFYEIIAGLTGDEKRKYGLLEADDYFYLNQVRYKVTRLVTSNI